MRRYSTSKKGTTYLSKNNNNNNNNNNSSNNTKNGFNRVIEWELRPGGMLVQKREMSDTTSVVMIKIKVSHGSYHHDITIPAHYNFGDLKRALAHETGLEPEEQRLLFRGKEKEDEECLDMVGVKDTSKIVLLEDPASKEKKLEAMKRNKGLSRAYEAVAQVRAEVDRLSHKVVALESMRVADKELVMLIESLMTQLLKLDTIEAGGEARAQRRIEVRRVQSFIDMLDNLRVRNPNPFSNGGNAVSVSTKWETFESGLGSLCSPIGSMRSSTKITHEWELFD